MSIGYTFRVCTSIVYNAGVFICLEGIRLYFIYTFRVSIVIHKRTGLSGPNML